MTSDDLKQRIIGAMRGVHDPEIPVNLYDLGLIYAIEIDEAGAVQVRMTLTTPNCPIADQLPRQVKTAVEGVEGVNTVDVELVWEPRWTSELMSEDARLQLEMMGISWSDPSPAGSRITPLTLGRTARPDADKE